MSSTFHPALDPWIAIGLLLLEVAGTKAADTVNVLRPKRGRDGAYRSRHPGLDSPLWNLFAARLRERLKPYGAKARLARFLGIPRQRLDDFLRSRSRLPDAEVTLQLLIWYAQMHARRDRSL